MKYFLVALTAILLALGLAAQTPDTATLRGHVADPSAASVPGATVTVTNRQSGLTRSVATDANGDYALAGLPIAGEYEVAVNKAGFAVTRQDHIALIGGATATADLKLNIAAGQSTITVTGAEGQVRSDEPQLGNHLTAAQIAETPIFNNQITYLPLLNSANRPSINMGDVFMNQNLITTNGGGRRQTSFEVDGANANDSWGRQTIFSNVPVSAVQEMTILENAFSSEYGSTTGGVVNIVTQSGGQALHGSLLYAVRPNGTEAALEGFNSTGFTASTASGALSGNDQTTDHFNQAAWSIGGPMGRRTQFFVSGEDNFRDRASPITSPLDPSLYLGHYRDGLMFARLDHQFSDRTTGFLRADIDSFYDTNPNGIVGGNSLPTVARVFKRKTYSAEMGITSVLSPTWTNASRLQFQLASPITEFDPVNYATAFSVTINNVTPGLNSSFTTGTSTAAKLLNHQYEANDTVAANLGRHSLRFGFDAISGHDGGNSKEFGGPSFLGTFTFNPCDASVHSVAFCESTWIQTYANASSFSQSFGLANYTVNDALYSGFIQDDFHATRKLTVNLGLRYERQTFTDSKKNFAPRLGFAYSPAKGTVIRGGYGLYYSQVVDNSEANYALSGPTGVFTFTANAGKAGFPTALVAYPSLAAAQAAGGSVPLLRGAIYIRPGMANYYNQFFPTSVLSGYQNGLYNPYSEQGTFGIEHSFHKDWVLSADYVGTHTLKINRPLDLDAPPLFTRNAPNQFRGANNGVCIANATAGNTAATALATCASNAANIARPLWIYDAANGLPNQYTVIQSDVNDGVAWYNALEINLNHRFNHNFQMLASYTWSHTMDTVDPDATGQSPNDPQATGLQEKGNALYNQPQRFVLSGTYALPWKVRFGGVTTLASGLSFNPVTGTVNGGDSGGETDRAVINGVVVARNSGHTSPYYSVDPFIERPFTLGERMRLDLRAESFNFLNHANFAGFNGTFGNGLAAPAAYGTPNFGVTSQFIAREFQFSAKLSF